MRVLVFDSGIGGLGIVGALRQTMPQATIGFVADNAAFPYGEKPDDWLVERIGAVIGAAIERLRPDLAVIACNTASTLALGALRARFDLPFVGVVPPIKWAAAESRSRVIGLLATAATVRRGYLADLQSRYAPDCTLIAHGARGLADLAEQRFRTGLDLPPDPRLLDAIRTELRQLFARPDGARIDAVAIGCTHYTFLLDALAEAAPQCGAGGPILWLDPAGPVARHAARLAEDLVKGAEAQVADLALFTGPVPDSRTVGLARFGFHRVGMLDVAMAHWPA
jgi:glutamate racemase